MQRNEERGPVDTIQSELKCPLRKRGHRQPEGTGRRCDQPRHSRSKCGPVVEGTGRQYVCHSNCKTYLLGDVAVLAAVVALLRATEAGTGTTAEATGTGSRRALTRDVADATAALNCQCRTNTKGCSRSTTSGRIHHRNHRKHHQPRGRREQCDRACRSGSTHRRHRQQHRRNRRRRGQWGRQRRCGPPAGSCSRSWAWEWGTACQHGGAEWSTYGGAQVASLSATVALGATDGGASGGKVAGWGLAGQ